MLVLLRTPTIVVTRTITTLRRSLNARRFIGAQLLTTESTAKRGILASTHLAAILKEHVKHKKICAGLCKNMFFGRGFSSPGISDFSAFSRLRIACGGFYVVGVAVKGWEVVRGSNGGIFCCGGSALVWGLMVVTCKTGNQGSRNTNLIMVWAWMLWLSHALETRTLLWVGLGCSGGLSWFGNGCSGDRMLSRHESYYGLGMDAGLSDAVEHGKTRCAVYAVFRALETPRLRGSSHSGHIRRGRPHLLRVYPPATPITIAIIVIVVVANPKS